MGNTIKWEMWYAEGDSKNAKTLFLETQKEVPNSYATYFTLFGNISSYERFIGRDIFDMNWNELKNAFQTLTIDTLKSAASTKSKIVQYIQFAIDGGMSNRNMELGLLKACPDEDLVSITAMENQYVTKEELDLIKGYAKSYQDKAFLTLLFNGAGGKRLSEITEIKTSDINKEDSTVHLHGIVKKEDKATGKMTEVKGDRFIKLSEEEIEELIIAGTESYIMEYKPTGKNDVYNDKNWVSQPLVVNDYVFRRKATTFVKDSDELEINDQALTLRLKSLVKDEEHQGIGLKKPKISVKTLHESGKLHELRKIKMETGIITDEDFKKVVLQFNLAENSYSSLKQTYDFMVKRNMIFVRVDD